MDIGRPRKGLAEQKGFCPAFWGPLLISLLLSADGGGGEEGLPLPNPVGLNYGSVLGP